MSLLKATALFQLAPGFKPGAVYNQLLCREDVLGYK
jgi:hypothetical protein